MALCGTFCHVRAVAMVASIMQVNWSSGMGDLTIIGWLTVGEYFAACICCFVAGKKIEPMGDNAARKERRIWLSIAILFFALGISRLLGLETTLLKIGRSIAFSEGWYPKRQNFELAFIAGVTLTCLAALRALVIWLRKAPLSTWVGVTGTILIIAYLFIRAASLHQIDVFIARKFLVFRWNWIFEMEGIGLVIFASMWRNRVIVRSRGLHFG